MERSERSIVQSNPFDPYLLSTPPAEPLYTAAYPRHALAAKPPLLLLASRNAIELRVVRKRSVLSPPIQVHAPSSVAAGSSVSILTLSRPLVASAMLLVSFSSFCSAPALVCALPLLLPLTFFSVT